MSKKIHSVKILPTYFEAFLSGDKTFEIRYNDRDYKVGDLLCLKEFCDGEYTGRETVREICYMIDDPEYCKEGYVVLGLKSENTIELPCKVGDTVYVIFSQFKNEILKCRVDEILIQKNTKYAVIDIHYKNFVAKRKRSIPLYSLGAFAFLTKEEAEKALAKMKDDEQKTETYFSPEDVRKMTQLEVRKNYQAIMNSMKKWQ